MRTILMLVVLYAAAYGLFRQTHIEVWEKDNQAYVIFPAGGLGKALYYAWRPLTYADAAATGMRFHIGPHQ